MAAFDSNSFDTDSFDPNAFDFGGGSEGPDPFLFQDENNVPLSTLITSASVQILGLSAPADISISGGDAEYSINGGAWTSAPGVGAVNDGDLVRARVTSSGSNSTGVDVTVTINAVSDVWTVSTQPAIAPGWNQGIVGNELGFDYLIQGLGIVGTVGISTHD